MAAEGYDPREVARRYAQADLEGRSAIMTGNIDAFGTFYPGFERNFAVSLYLDEASERKVADLATRTAEIIERHGGDVRCMGRDYPVHLTLQNGRYWGKDADEENEHYRAMFDEARAGSDADTLVGTTIEMKYELQRPDGIILTSIAIPPAVKHFREALVAAAPHNGITDHRDSNKPLGPYPGFLHMTLVRFNSMPKDAAVADAIEKELIDLRHQVSAQPLTITTDAMDYKNPMQENFARPPHPEKA